MSEYNIFTSESVSEGHPDKMADQISDAILDAILAEDRQARVAVETLVKTGMAVVAGEVRTSTYVDLEDIVRNVILDIGYNSSDIGFDVFFSLSKPVPAEDDITVDEHEPFSSHLP